MAFDSGCAADPVRGFPGRDPAGIGGAPPGATTFSGSILDIRGRPLSGATVDFAVPRAGPEGGYTEAVFASTRTGPGGAYNVSATLPTTAGSRDHAVILITATSGSNAVHHSLLLQPAVSAITGSLLDDLPAEVPVSLQMGRGDVHSGSASASISLPTSDAGPSENDVDVAPPVPGPDGDGLVGELRGTSACLQTYATFWAPEYNVRKRRFVPVQRVTTRSHSTQTYTWETTTNTTLQIAYTGDGGSYSGGLTSSKENATGLGMRMYLRNRKTELLRIEWEFVRYRKKCLHPCHSCGSDFYLDVYQWRPYQRTSGSRRGHSVPPWTCDRSTTVLMPTETWVARTSRVRWQGWFSIGGVKLDAHQTNSEHHQLTVHPDAGERAPRICGSNDYPANANRIRERRD